MAPLSRFITKCVRPYDGGLRHSGDPRGGAVTSLIEVIDSIGSRQWQEAGAEWGRDPLKSPHRWRAYLRLPAFSHPWPCWRKNSS